MKRFISGLGLGVFCAATLIVGASTVNNSQLVNFTQGDTLRAVDLVNNTATLQGAINDNYQLIQAAGNQTINFSDYLLSPSYSTKVFEISDTYGGTTACNKLTRVYNRTTDSVTGVETVERVQTREDTNVPSNTCGSPVKHYFERSTSKYVETKNIVQTTDPNNILVDDVFNYQLPVTIFRSGVRVGDSFGGGTTAVGSFSGTISHTMAVSQLLEKIPQLQVATSPIPYSDCIVLGLTRNTASMITWYCKGYGMVRRMDQFNLWELKQVL